METTFRLAIYQSRWLLLFSLLVQLIFCLTQTGYFHPDQHFQLIEFSSWQLGQPSGAGSVWELSSHIRPTFQVYLFSGFIELCHFIGVYDAYAQLTLLRLIFGLCGFVFFNAMGIYYFKADRRLLGAVLILINLSWALPYIRTLFSSEMASSLVFFGAILLYQKKGDQFLYTLLTGLLFSLAFYLRFQVAFGLVGFGLWLLIIDKQYARLLPMALGFCVGVGVNVLLDFYFYHQFVFTPYEYFRVNITEGKAAEFGTAGPLYYIVMLLLVIGTPPGSFFLFYCSIKGAIKQYRQPLVWAVVVFIIGHCLVGHKEERFLFPVVPVLPVIAGWGLPGLLDYYQRSTAGVRRYLNSILYISIGLTTITLVLLAFTPISQTIEFSRKLSHTFEKEKPTIYCLARTPFETESGLPLIFYRRNATNINLVKFHKADSVRHVKNVWLVSTYNEAKNSFPLLDSLGFKPQFYSSTLLWKTNQFLQSKDINTINEIWVLYKQE